MMQLQLMHSTKDENVFSPHRLHWDFHSTDLSSLLQRSMLYQTDSWWQNIKIFALFFRWFYHRLIQSTPVSIVEYFVLMDFAGDRYKSWCLIYTWYCQTRWRWRSSRRTLRCWLTSCTESLRATRTHLTFASPGYRTWPTSTPRSLQLPYRTTP